MYVFYAPAFANPRGLRYSSPRVTGQERYLGLMLWSCAIIAMLLWFMMFGSFVPEVTQTFVPSGSLDPLTSPVTLSGFSAALGLFYFSFLYFMFVLVLCDAFTSLCLTTLAGLP